MWCGVYLRTAVHWKICRMMQVPALKSSYTQNQIWLWLLLWTTQRWVQSLKLWETWKSQLIERQNSSYLSYFLRFWKLLLSDLTPKHCVYQHIQVNFAIVIFAEHVTFAFEFLVNLYRQICNSFFLELCYEVPSCMLITDCLSLAPSPSVFVVERLAYLSSGEWSAFLQQVCAVLESVEKAGSGATSTPRAKLNLLCYLCCVCGHRDTATRFIHSQLVSTVWVPITHNLLLFFT